MYNVEAFNVYDYSKQTTDNSIKNCLHVDTLLKIESFMRYLKHALISRKFNVPIVSTEVVSDGNQSRKTVYRTTIENSSFKLIIYCAITITGVDEFIYMDGTRYVEDVNFQEVSRLHSNNIATFCRFTLLDQLKEHSPSDKIILKSGKNVLL